MRRRRRSRRTTRKMLFGLCISCVVLFILEVGLRLLGAEPAYLPNRIGGWMMMPQMDQQTVLGTKEAHRFVVSTNADGMRTNLKEERTAGTRRVALLGDSIIFGWGCDDGQTIADSLQATLGADHPDLGPIEVLNAAQPGYSTTQMARFFDQVVADYRPDLSVVFMPMHDHNLVLVSDREHLDGPTGPMSLVRVGLARHSRIYGWIREQIFPLSGEAFVMPQANLSEPRVPRTSDVDRARNFAEMRTKMGVWGGSLAIGHVPFMQDLAHETPNERVGVAWGEQYTEQTGVGMVDLRACCGPDGEDHLLAFDPGHFSPKGNAAVGKSAAKPSILAA
jgi:lysophospholipase L1-like esterase